MELIPTSLARVFFQVLWDAKDPQDALPYHQVGHVHVPTSEMCKHAAQDRLSRTLSWTCCAHDVVNVNTHIDMHDIY